MKISDIADLLINGAVGILPTDTIYGLVARAADKRAVSRLYQLKSRDKKPGTIIAANVQQLIDLGVDAGYLAKAEKYWPNPISVIIPVDDKLFYMHQGVGSLAFRVVNDNKLIDLLTKTGPLMTSSANHPGQIAAKNIDEAKTYFGNQVDFYVDGGDYSQKNASTIIKLDGDEVIVVRRGTNCTLLNN